MGISVTTKFICSIRPINLWRWRHVGIKEVPRAENHLRLVRALYLKELRNADVRDLVYV